MASDSVFKQLVEPPRFSRWEVQLLSVPLIILVTVCTTEYTTATSSTTDYTALVAKASCGTSLAAYHRILKDPAYSYLAQGYS